MTTHGTLPTRRVLTLARLTAGGAAFAGLLAACNVEDVLRVDDPDVIRPEQITTKEALPNVLAATVGDFAVAYSGSSGSEGQIQMVALITDEMINSESFPTRIEVDQRAINEVNATMLGIFRDIQRARATAEIASGRYAQLDPANAGRAEVLALGGFTYVLFAENYCSGVPFSSEDPNGVFVYGEPETTDEILARAVAKFDTAIRVAGAAGSAGTTPLRLARLGMARALLNRGLFAQAADTARLVPTSFRYQIVHTENSPRQYNGIFSFAQNIRRFSIAEVEGGTGLPFRTIGASDARAPVRRNPAAGGVGFDAVTPHFITAKYPNRSAPAIVADGIEARLIEAEAALRAGNDAEFLRLLNEARANAQTYAVPPATPPAGPGPILALPATQREKEDLLFRERAINLFLTSHRLGDLRRLIRQYQRTEDEVFPTGAYFKGGIYGDDVNFPIPVQELNNPEFKGCLNRSA